MIIIRVLLVLLLSLLGRRSCYVVGEWSQQVAYLTIPRRVESLIELVELLATIDFVFNLRQ